MPAAPAERSAGAARVLLVDDDPSVLDTLAAILRTGGYEVLPVATAQAAIEALRRQTIDALVVDLRLSGQDDGLTILSAAVREQPDVVGIVLTGYGTLESAIQALDAGAFSYLLKPCNPDQLQAAVLRGLEKRATARALVELQHAVARAVEDRAEAQLRDAESREAEAREAAARSSRRLSQL
ncbi:MAG TPA: response regulator, partial [Chloroflexota bacterium]